ncbi:MAG: hypothetical protein ACJ716_12620 [Marmoricola sp.]
MSRSRSLGLGLLGLLSALDATAPLFAGDGNPPMAVNLVASVLGLASLGCIFYVVRGADRALQPLIVLRVLSALSAVPAFFVDDVPSGLQALAGGIIAGTVIGLWLVLVPAREVQVR